MLPIQGTESCIASVIPNQNNNVEQNRFFSFPNSVDVDLKCRKNLLANFIHIQSLHLCEWSGHTFKFNNRRFDPTDTNHKVPFSGLANSKVEQSIMKAGT